MFIVYTKEKFSKKVFDYNIDKTELQTVMGGNIFLDHPELNPNDYIVVEQDYPFINPTYDDVQNIIRELTREERILNGELELLQDGEYVNKNKIIVVPCQDDKYFKKIWDKNTHAWKEGATSEEIKNDYFRKINQYKSEILQNGFDFNSHQQKCREKDLALLGNAVSALDDMQAFAVKPTEEHKINWAFNDNDIVNMTETDLRKMRISGATFINNVYAAEAHFKSSAPNHNFKKQEFVDKINSSSTVKCYKQI